MSLQDAFRELVTTDLDQLTDDEHELDLMAAMLRHDVMRTDVMRVPRFNQVLDLLGRFAPTEPVNITLLIKALFPHGSVYTLDAGRTVLAFLDALVIQDVLRDDDHDPDLVHIPDHVADWARGYSVRMRREDQPGLPDETTVAAQLVEAATHLTDFALAHDRRDLVQAILPHARFWLRSFARVSAPELIEALQQIIVQAEVAFRSEERPR